MKLENERQRKEFIKVIDELRQETNHQKSFINRDVYDELKWLWSNAQNRTYAKDWFKIALGW